MIKVKKQFRILFNRSNDLEIFIIFICEMTALWFHTFGECLYYARILYIFSSYEGDMN